MKEFIEARRKMSVSYVLMVLFIYSGLISSAEAWNPIVDTIFTIKEYGKTIDWSHTNDLITFARPGVDSFYDVHVMKPDGTNEISLTGGVQGCPQKHNGCPVWHPSGEYIVYTAQNEDSDSNEWSIPGKGLNCNLWAMTNDGSRFWQLTYLPTLDYYVKGVIHPQFSNNGTKLLWAERLGPGGIWGEWALKIADFVIGTDTVYLENVTAYQPGEQHVFYESHAFSIEDSMVLFSGNLIDGQPENGIDIYEFDYGAQNLTRLTSTFDDWDEHADYSPDGEKIAWMSSTGFDIPWDSIDVVLEWRKYLITELWTMDADGSRKQRMTYFNESSHPEYIGGRAVVSDNVWGPDGHKIAATVAYEIDTLGTVRSKIVMIEFKQTSVEESKSNYYLKDFHLFQNHPNPFNRSTVISYSISDPRSLIQEKLNVEHSSCQIQLRIYDTAGRLVKSFPATSSQSPISSIVWDGTNNLGQDVKSGIFLYRLEIGDNLSQTKKMLLLR